MLPSSMPRQLRVEYPGAVDHVMSRGERREGIFLDDVARHDLLKTLAEVCLKTGWQAHGCCLMRNPDPVVVETPNAFLAVGMAWRQSGSTIRSNHRHRLCGHGFSGRPKAQRVEGSEAFRQEQLRRMEGKLGEDHPGELRLKSAEAQVESGP